MNPVVDINAVALGQVLCASVPEADAQLGISSESIAEGGII